MAQESQAPEPSRLWADITTDASRGATTVVISAIDGMAGIGKTALAVRAGHLLAEKFPDGQLFVVRQLGNRLGEATALTSLGWVRPGH